MKKYMWDGSYTVEAAFLFPMLMGILFAWMFEVFYLHDQVIAQEMLQNFLIEEKESAIAKKWEDSDQNKSLANLNTKGDSDVENDNKSSSGGLLQVKKESFAEERDEIQRRMWVMKILYLKRNDSILRKKYEMQTKSYWDIPVMSLFMREQMLWNVEASAEKMTPVEYLRLGMQTGK